MPDKFEDTQGNQSSWSSVTRRSVGEDEGKRDHIWQVMVDFYSEERMSRRRK